MPGPSPIMMTRRAFLKMNIQLAFLAGLQTKRATDAGVFQAPCPGAAYGSGAYGQGCYSGCCVPSKRVYLPTVHKGGG